MVAIIPNRRGCHLAAMDITAKKKSLKTSRDVSRPHQWQPSKEYDDHDTETGQLEPSYHRPSVVENKANALLTTFMFQLHACVE